ncbi:sialidase-like [Pyrus ussuriensis x Pyrus communis]|uniref:Sialidase-like n=1 Tax=Pyrus ussuriensis x Pyrus communis TaxID=2448454 RepID=A0A5N5HWF7_9ROSA|nr:sialidase-like [Pyrus ussuriensis x Pyrus communis]
MAGYDHNYRSGYSNGTGGGPQTNKWNKTSYADDECRTIIVGADGTRRTIIGCAPFQQQGSYVMKTETIIRERILSPAKEYGYADDWSRPSSPAKGYGYAADDHKLHRPSSPAKGYAVGDRYPRKPSSPVKGYGYSADHQQLHRPSSPEDDYPQEVGDFLTKVQTEASRDQRANRHQPAPKAAHNDTYGDYSNYNNKTSYKPNGNTIRNDNHDDYPPKYYSDMGPNTVTNGGHQPRPSRPAWTPQPSGPAWTPPSREGRLSSATDDIETVLRFLKEGAMSSSAAATTPQYSQYSTVPKHGEYPMDAAKRNATFNAPSWPRTT